MKEIIKRYSGLLISLIVVSLFFYPLFLYGLLPVPADTIVGLYHPFRDLFAGSYPNGIPFKNFLITDPVRQLIPWKDLAMQLVRSGSLPLWNPYEMIGKPLLANFQSGVLYPLNILFFIPSFSIAWSVYIFSQMILGAVFFYLYMSGLGIRKAANFLATVAFVFSGFFIVWLEWGNVIHTYLWLPLILLSIDRIISLTDTRKNTNKKGVIIWSAVFLLSTVFSFFAGHLQIFFYIALFSCTYFLFKWVTSNRSVKTVLWLFLLSVAILILTAVQWIPTLQFILLSNRTSDQSYLTPGFFMPYQNLIQFIIPDFFGNPTTLNYWGVWNYAEFVGYIGFVPFVFALYAFFFRHDKKTYFYSGAVIASVILMVPNTVSFLPYLWHVPFLSTSQPTRLLSITVFSLVVLCGLGSDYLIKNEIEKKIGSFKHVLMTFLPFAFFFTGIWLYILVGFKYIFPVSYEHILVTKHNAVLPTILFLFSFSVLFAISKIKITMVKNIAFLLLLLVTVIDVLRFGVKFETFSSRKYFFPETRIIQFLMQQKGVFRVASIDNEVLPPNFATYYKIQSIDGYDPLYLLSYGEYIAALERQKADIHQPFGYNRIITPHNINSQLFDLLNTKFVLSLGQIRKKGYSLVLQEGQTRLYRNNNAFDRAFFVTSVLNAVDSKDAIGKMYSVNLKKTAVIEDSGKINNNLGAGSATITRYKADRIVIRTENDMDGFLVVSDAYYPTWEVSVDGKESKIYKTDLTLRGVFVPKGNHTVTMHDKLF